MRNQAFSCQELKRLICVAYFLTNFIAIILYSAKILQFGCLCDIITQYNWILNPFLYVLMQHNEDYVIAAVFGGYFSIRRSRHSAKLYYQPHVFHTLTVFISGGDNINSCGVDATVAENVCELGNILFDSVKCSSEQVTQIMRKHLLRIYSRLLTKAFHFTPNVGSAHRLAASSDEYCT